MTTDTESARYCAGCMSSVAPDGHCAACGWDDRQEPEVQVHLPRHYVLFDRYYIGRVLGQGGFGVTYLARDLNLNRLVAVKEYFPLEQCSRATNRATVHSHGGDKKEQFEYGLQGFLKEAQALAQLDGHANIVSIADFRKGNGTAYLVMSYIDGISLKQYLANQGGKLSCETATAILMPVMDALREIHSRGLLHRDISPANIMITREGQVRVVDFGAARYAIGEHSKSLSMILKPGYAPEEQYRTHGKQGPWTDVYATAATLYHCITGVVPPPAPDRMADDELVPPSKYCPDIPPQIEAAVLKGLAIRANDRYQDIQELQQELLVRDNESPKRANASPGAPDTSIKALKTKRVPVNAIIISVGLIAFGTSFAVPAFSTRTTVLSGWDCAYTCIAIPLQLLFSKHDGSTKSSEVMGLFLYGSMFIAGLINPVFLLSGVSRIWTRTRKIASVLTKVQFPMQMGCWIVFAWFKGFPRQGYYLWLLGMLLVAFSGQLVRWFWPREQMGNGKPGISIAQHGRSHPLSGREKIFKWTLLSSLVITVVLGAGTWVWSLNRSGKQLYDAQEYAAALPKLQKAANGGDSKAAVLLAYMYERGNGVPQDYGAYREWLKKASDLGDSEAAETLGENYEVGENGVEKSAYEAQVWYARAYSTGSKWGALYLARLYANGGANFDQDFDQARIWYEKQLQRNPDSLVSMNELGDLYRQGGHGLTKNYAQAAGWYEKVLAADKESLDKSSDSRHAVFELGWMLQNGGNGLDQDYAKSIEWFKKGADAGDDTSMDFLAYAYQRGDLGVPQDLNLAREWYQKAIAKGNEDAKKNLASMNQ